MPRKKKAPEDETGAPAASAAATDEHGAAVETSLVEAPVSEAGGGDTENPLVGLAERINAVVRSSALQAMREIGELVIQEMFGGDLAAWRQRGKDDPSLRQLAALDELEISPAGLHRALHVYELDCFLLEHHGRGVSDLKRLPATAVYQTNPLPVGRRAKLVLQGDEEGWTADEMREHVKSRKGSSNAGRPPLPRFEKTVNKMTRWVEDEDEFFGDLEAVDELDPEKAQALFSTVVDMKRRLEALGDRLRGRISAPPGDDDLPPEPGADT